MKMARASDKDMGAAISLCSALDSINSTWSPTMPAELCSNDGCDDPFDIDDLAQCQAVLRHLMELADCSRLFRVVFGMACVMDPANKLIDLDCDHLETHPIRDEHEADSRRLRWLTEDHADQAVCEKRNEIIGRMSVMSYSAVCADIDAATAGA